MNEEGAGIEKSKIDLTEKEFAARVIEIIASNCDIKERNKVNLRASMADDLGIDSLDIIEIIMALESLTEIEINEGDIEVKMSVGQVIAYLKTRLEFKKR